MTCASEGAVDVYVEPFVQARLARSWSARRRSPTRWRGWRAAWTTTSCASSMLREQPTSRSDAASLGVDGRDARRARGDRSARALPTTAPSSSPRRATTTRRRSKRRLRSRRAVRRPRRVAQAWRDRAARCSKSSGVPGVGGLRSPAGLDLGARTAPEVALSILAEIVQTLPNATAMPASRRGAAERRRHRPPRRDAVDPVCGMHVDVATARHTAEVDGVRYYFCCANCRARFVKQPQDYRRTSHDGRRDHPRPLPRARLHRRRGVRDRAADHARAREAAAHRGTGRRRQDRERQGARRRARHAADSAAVLRRPRRDGGALRVELPASDAARAPERGRRLQPRGARSADLQRAVPAQAAAARGDYARSNRPCCSSTKSIAPTRRSRRFSSRCWPSGR